ncbi:PAS domain S-box protein, partial [bacterium]|nr:PAS domain S-box protein [bacterium]
MGKMGKGENIYFHQHIRNIHSGRIKDIQSILENFSYSEDDLRVLRKFPGVIIVALSDEGEVTFINDDGAKILGYSPEEIVGKNWFKNFLPERLKEKIHDVFKFIITGNIEPFRQFENPLVTKNGEEISVFWVNNIIYDAARKPIGIISSGFVATPEIKRKFIRDFPQLPTTDELISLTEILLKCRAVYQENQVVDLEIVGTSKPFEILLGIGKDELIGKNLSEILSTESINILLETVQYCLDEDFSLTYETYLPTFKKYFKITILPLENKELLISFYDISDYLSLSNKLTRLNTILFAIRNINQIITQKTDINELLKEATQKLNIIDISYSTTFIALLDENFNMTNYFISDPYNQSNNVLNWLKQKKAPECVKLVWNTKDLVVFDRAHPLCQGCPLKPPADMRMILSPLKYKDKVYGVFGIIISPIREIYPDEKSLITEISSDIAFAIYTLELEKERQRYIESLEIAEERQRKYLNSTNDFIFLKDENSRYILINRAFAEFINLKTEAEVVGKTDFDFFNDQIAKFLQAQDRKVLKSKREITFFNKIGSKIFLTKKFPVKLHEGKYGVGGNARDITQMLKTREYLKKALQTQGIVNSLLKISLKEFTLYKILETAFNLALSMMEFRKLRKGALLLLDEERKKLKLIASSNLTEEEIARYSDLPFDQCISKDVISGGKIYFKPIGDNNIYYIPIMDGQDCLGVMLFYSHKTQQNDETTRFLETVANTLSGVIQRKRAEQALEDERERLAITLHSIGDGVITTDRNGIITDMNAVAEELTGWRREDAIGRKLDTVFRIINEETRQPAENVVQKVINSGKVVGLANGSILIARDGTERIIADSGAPIKDSDGNLIGVVLVFRDITEEVRTQKELQRMNRLESLGVLAAGIAHDFNNILTAILLNISHAKLLAEGTGDEKIAHVLEGAENATY